METSKLITTVVWATIILVVYEALKSVSTTQKQLGGGTQFDLNVGLQDAIAAGEPAGNVLLQQGAIIVDPSLSGTAIDGTSGFNESSAWNF